MMVDAGMLEEEKQCTFCRGPADRLGVCDTCRERPVSDLAQEHQDKINAGLAKFADELDKFKLEDPEGFAAYRKRITDRLERRRVSRLLH
jgi:hypothetical protein